jgi:hypothetical protein
MNFHTNQSIYQPQNLFVFPKRTKVSMPHGKTQLMLMCPSLNVALIKTPPSTNLQQDTQYPHGIAKSIIGVFTIIQGMNIFGYAQHSEITVMD